MLSESSTLSFLKPNPLLQKKYKKIFKKQRDNKWVTIWFVQQPLMPIHSKNAWRQKAKLVNFWLSDGFITLTNSKYNHSCHSTTKRSLIFGVALFPKMITKKNSTCATASRGEREQDTFGGEHHTMIKPRILLPLFGKMIQGGN